MRGEFPHGTGWLLIPPLYAGARGSWDAWSDEAGNGLLPSGVLACKKDPNGGGETLTWDDGDGWSRERKARTVKRNSGLVRRFTKEDAEGEPKTGS